VELRGMKSALNSMRVIKLGEIRVLVMWILRGSGEMLIGI